jgi:hypothetical protein
MANRDNHYEAAFEEYLRSRGVPYVAVDEARRSLLSDGASIKSLDFIVSVPASARKKSTDCEDSIQGMEIGVSVPASARDKSTDCKDSIQGMEIDVSAPVKIAWLVDVKGRRFPSGDGSKQYWKNWSTADDLRSLALWERLFGSNFCGLFVFAYDVLGDRSPLPAEELFRHRGKMYGFVAVPLSAYLGHARLISPRWDTLAMPTAKFRHYARPLSELLELPAGAERCAIDVGAGN